MSEIFFFCNCSAHGMWHCTVDQKDPQCFLNKCSNHMILFKEVTVLLLCLKLKPSALLIRFSSVQFSCSVVSDSVTPWTAACQASLSITNSPSLLKPMCIESVMPSNHLILWHPLLLLPSIFPSIRVFSNELALRIRWPKNWSFCFSISPSNEYSWTDFL